MFKRMVCFCLTICMLVLGGCTSTSKDIESISKNLNDITISVDPKIELLGIVISLSDYATQTLGGIYAQDTDYVNRVSTYFEKFKDHNVIKSLENIMQFGYAYDTPYQSLLYISDLPELKLQDNIDQERLDELYLVTNGKDNFESFINDLSDFAKESNFNKFFNENSDYYNSIIDDTINRIGEINLTKEIEDYYGKNNHSYNVVLNSLAMGGSFLTELNSDLYGILCPLSKENNMPVFEDGVNFDYLVRHEFSHSFVNNITTKNITEVNKYNKLYMPISEQMNSMAYTSWETCVNEHIVRAIVVRLTELSAGEELGKSALESEKKNGFIYIEDILESLKIYESNRDTYKNFEEFYPEILSVFEDINNK